MGDTIEYGTIRPPANEEELWKWAELVRAFLEKPAFPGDVDIGGNLDVTGDQTIGGTLDVTGDVDFSGDLQVDGDVNIDNDLTVDNDLTLGGDFKMVGVGKIAWQKKNANGVTLSQFTSADTVKDLRSANNGDVFTATEVAGAANSVVVDFVNIEAFNLVRILGWYDGGNTHALSIQLEITPFDGSAWHDLQYMSHSPGSNHTNEDHSFLAMDPVEYINNGVVKVRIIHNTPVANGHSLVLDEVALYQ
jgi:hypothetical protein